MTAVVLSTLVIVAGWITGCMAAVHDLGEQQ